MPPSERPVFQGLPPPIATRSQPKASIRLAKFLLFPAISAAAFISLWTIEPHEHWKAYLYYSVGIFTGDSAWAFSDKAPAGRAFRWLAIAAPVVTALGLTELITGRLWQAKVYLWAAVCVLCRSDTVCVYGLNERSLRFAQDAKELQKIPIILDDQPDEALLERCTWLGIAVTRTHPNWLRRAFGAELSLPVNACPDIVSFLSTVGSQVDLAATLTAWSPRPRSGKGSLAPLPARLYLITAERGLTQVLEDRLVLVANRLAASPSRSGKTRPPATTPAATPPRTTAPVATTPQKRRPRSTPFRVQPRLQDSHTLAARRLLLDHPFDVLADAFGQPTIHLVIYGFGGLGRTIARQAAQLYVTRPSLHDAKLKITAFDWQPEEAKAALLAEAPQIREVIDIEVHRMTIAPGGLRAVQASEAAAATGYIFTLGDGQVSLAAALSLRRWLLQPDDRFLSPVQEPVGRRLDLAPIFVSTSAHTGLGGVLRPEHSVKVGLFGFGAAEARFGALAILDDARERAGMAIHDAYVAHTTREAYRGDYAGRPGHTGWDDLPSALRESNLHVYDHLAIKARALGCRFVRLPDEADRKPEPKPAPATAVPLAGREETFSQLEHLRYRAERLASGWRPAARRFDAVRVHPDLVNWADLVPPEHALDRTQIDAIPQIAWGAQHSFGRALTIGVCGQRENSEIPERELKRWLRDTLSELHASHADRSLVVLTCLAKGADSWAAAFARDLGIPYIVPLPLPYELYREDFDAEELMAFDWLLDKAEYAFEMPLWATASTLTRQRSPGEPYVPEGVLAPNPARDRQYAAAGAYIFQRANRMLYVWDGVSAHGVGGTADVHSWHANGVPADLRLPDVFFPAPERPPEWSQRYRAPGGSQAVA